MRVVAELPHPECKITIFSMNQKYIIKFEQSGLEQSYKVGEIDLMGRGVDDVFELLDEEFINEVSARFAEMRKSFNAAYRRYN